MGQRERSNAVFPPLIVLFVCPACNHCEFLAVERSLPPEPGQVPYCAKCVSQGKWIAKLRQDYAIIPSITTG